MPDYAGALQRLAVSRTLWLVFAWPLVGLAWQIAIARPRIARSSDARAVLRALASARVAGLGCIALAATATLGHAVLLARLPAGARVLFQPLSRGVRYGDLDAGTDLLLDPRALAACALACAVALAAAVVLALRPAPQRGWRPWAWLQLALAGALLSFLADGFATVALGWSLASVAGAWLAGWRDVDAGVVVATRGAAALGALLVGASLLFWGLGGSWDDEGYAPDPHPRIAAVHAGEGVAGDASLTFTSLAGALVYLDDARTSQLRAPFVRAPLPAGMHSIRLHLGDGADDVVLARVDAAPGEELALVPMGPSLSFHVLADQLAIRDRRGPQVMRVALEDHPGPGGLAVVVGALLALLGAAGAMSAWSPPMAAPRPLVGVAAGATTSALGPFLLIRLAFLFPSAPRAGVVVAAVGGAVVLAALWHALEFTGARRWLAFAAAAPTGLTLVALGLAPGDTMTALEVMGATGLAAAGAYFIAARRDDDDQPPAPAQEGEPRRTSFDDALLARWPRRLGELLVVMDRWVVGAVISALAAAVRIAAWTTAHADERLLATPGDAAAARVQRATSAAEPWIGASPARAGWAVVAALALAALLHAAWPGG